MLSGPLSRTLFGAHFRADAGFTIGLIAAATALYGMRVFYFDQAFELARRTGPQAVIGGIAAGVGAVCSLVLIPRLGALGAAYSALTSNAVGVAVSILWGWKVFRMPLAAGIWLRTGAATIGMVAVIAFVPLRSGFLGLGLDIAAAALAYGACYSLAYVAPRTLVSRLRSLAAR
jgi:O-antigen/teichoic acid export membrane protein